MRSFSYFPISNFLSSYTNNYSDVFFLFNVYKFTNYSFILTLTNVTNYLFLLRQRMINFSNSFLIHGTVDFSIILILLSFFNTLLDQMIDSQQSYSMSINNGQITKYTERFSFQWLIKSSYHEMSRKIPYGYFFS